MAFTRNLTPLVSRRSLTSSTSRRSLTLRIIRKQYLIEQLKQFKQGTPEHEATSKALDEILDELDKLRDLGKELAHD